MNNMWGWSFKSKPSPLLVQGRVLLETTWKKTGPKRYGRAPIPLVLLRGGLGSPATCYFQKQSHFFLLSLITRCCMMICSAQSRQLNWFLSTLLQVGNAVPPPLGRALGLSIRQAMATLKEAWHQDLYPKWSQLNLHYIHFFLKSWP